MGVRLNIVPGMVFEKWTVIDEVTHTTPKGKPIRVFQCRCVCGRVKKVQLSHLRSGASSGCVACQRRAREEVLPGTRFGEWTVLSEGPWRNGNRHLDCQCNCGTRASIDIQMLRSKKSTRCRRCRQTYPNVGDLTSTLWVRILRNAALRNIPVRITQSQAWELFLNQHRKCALSGLPLILGHKPDTNTASLDRVDNTKGYEQDNVQWLHKDINKMKNVHEQAYFLRLCAQIASHNRLH